MMMRQWADVAPLHGKATPLRCPFRRPASRARSREHDDRIALNNRAAACRQRAIETRRDAERIDRLAAFLETGKEVSNETA